LYLLIISILIFPILRITVIDSKTIENIEIIEKNEIIIIVSI